MLAVAPTIAPRPMRFARPSPTGNTPVRVLIAHPSELMRTGLVELLRAEGLSDIPAGVGSVYEAYRVSSSVPTRVIVFDYERRGGREAARLLASLSPRPRLIALVAAGESIPPAEPLAAGVDGVVAIDGAGRQSFVAAIRAVLMGSVGVVAGFPVAPRHAASSDSGRLVPLPGGHGLTNRERELLYLIGEGLTNREIADLLTLSVKTVETHRSNLSRKLGLRSRAGLMRLALGQAAPGGPQLSGSMLRAPLRPADA